MTAQIKKIRRTPFVRFFADYVTCNSCDNETRGRVYQESERVVCSSCKAVLIDMETELASMTVVMFEPEKDDGES